jgi:hypothetical protein
MYLHNNREASYKTSMSEDWVKLTNTHKDNPMQKYNPYLFARELNSPKAN